MSAPHVLYKASEPEIRVTPSAHKTASPIPPSTPLAWEVVGWMGLAFLVIGAVDLLLGWIPTRFGSPEWEFGTVTRTLDNLPIVAMGMVLLLSSVAARGVAWATRAAALAAVVLGVLVLVAMVLYALDVPLAFGVVNDPLARSGLKRAVLKAAVQGTLYPAVLLTVGIKGIRHTLRARPRLS